MYHRRVYFFSGTIESNIKFGVDDASMDTVKEAADIAQASEFIEEKSGKYEAPIAQGGTNVSGGQKQRLSIARAIAKNPKIFIFDDSFSALDLKDRCSIKKGTCIKGYRQYSYYSSAENKHYSSCRTDTCYG